MAKFKDYFGIATSGFKATSRANKTEEEGISLFDQLKKYGTAEEKRRIREIEALRASKKTDYDKKPIIKPYE